MRAALDAAVRPTQTQRMAGDRGPADSDLADGGSVPYRRVRLEKGERAGDFSEWMAAGWRIVCSACDADLGHLFIPFSGGFIISGSTARLDPRLVERSGRETRTGHQYRRYGPPGRVFAKGKDPRSALEARRELTVNGPCWLYCYACNTGQALEPDHR